MLYGFDPNAPGAVAFTRGLRAVVSAESTPRALLYDEVLDLDRLPQNASSGELTKYLVEKYRGFRLDAILAVGTTALKFAVERLSARFADVPIVYGAPFEPATDFSALPTSVTGRPYPPPFVGTLRLARALQPDAERVILIGGFSGADSLLLATAVRDLTPLVRGLQSSNRSSKQQGK